MAAAETVRVGVGAILAADPANRGNERAQLAGSGAVIRRVSRPARFALHKLYIAAERPAFEAAKAAKDRRQAAALLEVLAADRPDDLDEAWSALAHRTSARRRIERELARLPAELRPALRRE